MTKYQLPAFNDEKQGIICNECLVEAEAEAQLEFSSEKVKIDSNITAHTNEPDSVSSQVIHCKKDDLTETRICLFIFLFSIAPCLLIGLLLWTVPTNRPDTSTEIIHPTITHSESWNYQSRPPYGYTLRKSQFSPRQVEWGNKHILPLTRFIFSGVIWEEWLLGTLLWADLMIFVLLVILCI
ncbi:hypothetical protein BHYA_0305g00030 [Botrytis hyacinthi]|uniref:Uncharacterized protein n=1 Tax=Botrytis hyacinthi TaxID=278943 RepID=A0A4Z1G6L9_9HELO|nr:hypothetical protein BHYA_0305g00030 [Botrytis hyacinthi]